MKRFLMAAATLAALSVSGHADDNWYMVTRTAMPGCTAREDFQKMARFARANDLEAMNLFMNSKPCRWLAPGTLVQIETSLEPTGNSDGTIICLRPKGAIDCYWTVVWDDDGKGPILRVTDLAKIAAAPTPQPQPAPQPVAPKQGLVERVRDVSWQCGGAKVTPPDNDRDPVAKTGLMMRYESSRLVSFDAVHTTISGAEYSRQDQYRDFRQWTGRDGVEYWSGVLVRNPKITMVGAFGWDKGTKLPIYVESVYSSGKLDLTIRMTCRYAGDRIA
jgi:hypothetical protein